MARIEVVDDEEHILDVVEFILREAGHEVLCAKNGREAMARLEADAPELIILDLNLPDTTGLELLRDIRAKQPELPVIMLTSRTDEIDRVVGLELGADDYVTKPFSNRELVARVGAVLRRSTQPGTADTGQELTHGPLELDGISFTARYHGQALTLTLQEFKLLEALVQYPARNFTRAALMERIYDPAHAVTERSIDASMSRLRRKLTAVRPEPNPIDPVYGIGYKLNANLEDGE